MELAPSDYPDYYGGAYINDFGKLVILVVGSILEIEPLIKEALPIEEFYLEQVEFKYKAY